MRPPQRGQSEGTEYLLGNQLRERDTIAWLERAYRQRDGGMGYLPSDRFFAPLRNDPRYQALLKKLNLT